MTCVRSAWLTLDDGRSIGLEGDGYFCTKLDLGSPTVRENVNNRPDNSGVTDRTFLVGSRVVSADITALSTIAGTSIDGVASAFGPFMDPGQRPTLHYVLERGSNPERVIKLRGSAYTWPIVGDVQRDIQLQWVAPDPFALDPVAQLATAWAGTGRPGRVYDMTYPRQYPAGSGTPVNGRVQVRGDTWVRPVVRIYGPLSGPMRVTFIPDSAPSDVSMAVVFLGPFSIDAGHFVSVDTDAHTAVMDDDPSQSVLSSLDWYSLKWPVLYPTDAYTVTMNGYAGTYTSQAQVSWNDRYYA